MEVSTSEKKSQDDSSSLCSQSLSIPSSSHTSSRISDHELEKAFEPLSQHPSRTTGPPLSRHATTIASTRSREPDFEVDWDENDPANPVNWSTCYKGLTIFSVAWSTFVVVVYSTSYTSGLRPMMTDFHLDSEPVVTLGVTTYRWFPSSIHAPRSTAVSFLPKSIATDDMSFSHRFSRRLYVISTHLRNVWQKAGLCR